MKGALAALLGQAEREGERLEHTNEPVVAILVAAAAIACEVVARVDLEVGRLKALMVAAQRAHARRPCLLDHQIPAPVAVALEVVC